MLRKVYLHGAMGERFGAVHELDVSSIKEVAIALGHQLKGFREFVVEHDFKCVAGKTVDDGYQLDESQVGMRVGGDIHMVPVVKGAKRAGLGKLIAGLLIAVVAFWALPALGISAIGAGLFGAAGISTTTIAMFGVSMALSGAAQMLAPKQKKQQSTSPEQKPSFVFNGAVNTTEQGGCVPLIYGETMVGSTVISAGMSVEEIPV